MKVWEYTDHWEGDKKVVTCIHDNCKTFPVRNEYEGKKLEKVLNELQNRVDHFRRLYFELKAKEVKQNAKSSSKSRAIE